MPGKKSKIRKLLHIDSLSSKAKKTYYLHFSDFDHKSSKQINNKGDIAKSIESEYQNSLMNNLGEAIKVLRHQICTKNVKLVQVI